MNTPSFWILIATGATIILILIYGCFVLKISNEKIFAGSGVPVSMAKMVLSSIHITFQIIFGILVIGIICILIIEGKIESNAGLPVISGIVGYLLGKSFKDVYDGASIKNLTNKPPKEKDTPNLT